MGDESESSEDGEEEKESEEEDSDQPEGSDEDNLHRRRQRKAAQQANYSFKEFDDMIKSALEDEGEAGNEANPENAEGKQLFDGFFKKNSKFRFSPRSSGW